MPPTFPISGSIQVTPRFPVAGPGGPGSPLHRYYQGATTSRTACPSAYGFACRVRACLPRFVSAEALPAQGQASRRAGSSVFRVSFRNLWHGQVRDLPGCLASLFLCLRAVPATPDDLSHLAVTGASSAAPSFPTVKASSLKISRLNSGASAPPVYASRPTLPRAMQDSVPAGGLRLCRAGVEPAGKR